MSVNSLQVNPEITKLYLNSISFSNWEEQIDEDIIDTAIASTPVPTRQLTNGSYIAPTRQSTNGRSTVPTRQSTNGRSTVPTRQLTNGRNTVPTRQSTNRRNTIVNKTVPLNEEVLMSGLEKEVNELNEYSTARSEVSSVTLPTNRTFVKRKEIPRLPAYMYLLGRCFLDLDPDDIYLNDAEETKSRVDLLLDEVTTALNNFEIAKQNLITKYGTLDEVNIEVHDGTFVSVSGQIKKIEDKMKRAKLIQETLENNKIAVKKDQPVELSNGRFQRVLGFFFHSG